MALAEVRSRARSIDWKIGVTCSRGLLVALPLLESLEVSKQLSWPSPPKLV